ncbi:FDLD family class I lanthipeptide [Streptomyces sp. NPDC006356]
MAAENDTWETGRQSARMAREKGKEVADRPFDLDARINVPNRTRNADAPMSISTLVTRITCTRTFTCGAITRTCGTCLK